MANRHEPAKNSTCASVVLARRPDRAGSINWPSVRPLLGWVGYALTRNLVRLWRAPVAEASTWTATRLGLCGGLLVFFSTGPLLEAQHIETKLLGTCWAELGTALLYLVPRQATFARLMVVARLTTLRSRGSVRWVLRQMM